MNNNYKNLSIEQLCSVIDLLHTSMDDYLYVYDFVNDFYYISPRAVTRFSMPCNSFHDVIQNHKFFVYPADLKALYDELEELKNSTRITHNMQYRWMDHKKDPVWINCCGRIVRNDDNSAIYMVGCINEIGKKPKADNISGLLGEASFKTYVEGFNGALLNGYVLRLGLDDFKEINEKHGIEYGDLILKKTAECISSCINPNHRLYRIFADEFLIADFSGSSLIDAISLYKRIRQSIDLFVEENHYKAVFTISGGILDCRNIKNYSNIMKLSEFSLNEAKKGGKNEYYIFAEKDYNHFLKKQELSRILRRAVNHNFEGFEAYFQPLCHTSNGLIYGAEALMRFYSKETGFVAPIDFIPILEETGLIIPAGRWMLNCVLNACYNIQKYIPDFKMSINISYIQLLKSDIINEIVNAVSTHNITPSKVIVELTESGLLEADARYSKLWSKLKNNGIMLALDDFGTGYSNFHYLYDLQPDIIKIDRSFTAKALENEYEYKLLSLMSKMVHTLNLKLCVEGIETTDDLTRIKEISPDYCQGYYFGKPCPYEQFMEQFINKN